MQTFRLSLLIGQRLMDFEACFGPRFGRWVVGGGLSYAKAYRGLLSDAPVRLVAMDELEQLPALVFKAAHDRNWALLAACLVLGVVWLVRRYGEAWVPWLGTDRGGACVSLAVAWGGGVAHALAAGEPIDGQLVVSALGVALTASGGWTVGKKLMGD